MSKKVFLFRDFDGFVEVDGVGMRLRLHVVGLEEWESD